jgi:hypothetical protein
MSEKEMSKIVYEGNNYELEQLRERMDQDLMDELDGNFTDQQFFDSYLIAHDRKYGERFVVD